MKCGSLCRIKQWLQSLVIYNTLIYTPICAQTSSAVYPVRERERLVIALLPGGLMTPRKPNRSWRYDWRVRRGSLLPSATRLFTTLQNSLLICCCVWAVWIMPASITISTRPAGTLSPGPSHRAAPQTDRSLWPRMGYTLLVSLPLSHSHACDQCDTAVTSPPAALDTTATFTRLGSSRFRREISISQLKHSLYRLKNGFSS